jgi:cytochrome c-type biogenesis protein CcsB
MAGFGYACLWLALALYAVTLARRSAGSEEGARDRALGRAATAAAALGWLALSAALAGRGLRAGHWPLTDRYEFALWFAWAIVGIYLLLELRWRSRVAGAFALAAAVLVVTYALLQPASEKAIVPLLPALRSVWLQFHVVAAAIGYGACGVAAGIAAAQLALAGPAGTGAADAGGRRLDSGIAERQSLRVIGWGFPWLTFALLTGAIWAQDAWGRYWGWDPKETWTLIVWLWYLLLLHSRSLRGWQGRRLAWLTLAGFGIVCFAFAGLPWLLRTVQLTSLHTF